MTKEKFAIDYKGSKCDKRRRGSLEATSDCDVLHGQFPNQELLSLGIL